MKRLTVWAIMLFLPFLLDPAMAADTPVPPHENFILYGKVMDNEAQGINGAEVAVYRSPDVRRPVDFLITTAKGGSYETIIPAGRYWVVARHRTSPRFGPLEPGDRHSGNPVEIVAEAQDRVRADLIVTALRDAVRQNQATSEGMITITGVLSDQKGLPAAGAYLYARRDPQRDDIPDFISAWTDRSGEYTLSVPPGTYFVGAAVEFPPPPGGELKKFTVSGDSIKVVLNADINI